MLASELWKQWTLTYAINDGHYIWWYLPFQLCSIPMYICLTLGILFLLSCYTDSSARQTTYCHISSRLQSFLMDFGLLGGIFAFFDTSGMHYGYLPLTNPFLCMAYPANHPWLHQRTGSPHRPYQKRLTVQRMPISRLLSDRNSAESYAVSPRYH